MSWEIKAKVARAQLDDKIPPEWRLDPAILQSAPQNILPLVPDLLSTRENELTSTRDATDLLEKLHTGEWSAEEVTAAFCHRAAIAHQLVRCLMDIDFEGAISRARELDQYLAQNGKLAGPLHGLPVSLKDLVSVKGVKHTFGYVSWADRVAESDAVAVQALREAGAIIFVKTTMPQTGLALETVSNLWGRTLNPFNTLLSAGGSSGGEGALLACQGSPIGIGTDSGGSIRAPAAFNGIYALKPSSKRVSYNGCQNDANGIVGVASAIGPMGRSIRDLDFICNVLSAAEPWYQDSNIVEKPWVSTVEVQKREQKVSIGVMWWDGVVMPHPPIQRALKIVVDSLRAAGHEVVEVAPYRHGEARELSRKVSYITAGHETKQHVLASEEPLIAAAHKSLSTLKTYTPVELIQNFRNQKAFKDAYLHHWNATASQTASGKPMQALLTPAAACCSFPHDFNVSHSYFSFYNLVDYPAVVLPIAKANSALDTADTAYTPTGEEDRLNHGMYNPELFQGMPVALQLVGRALAEEKLLAVAEVVRDVVESG